MHVTVRQRRSHREFLYGPYAAMMDPDGTFFRTIRDRAAYVYIVGNFPSHLRKESTGVLRQVTRAYRRPSSLDGRVGNNKLNDDVVADLTLEQHPMVLEVRYYIRQGYLLLGPRGYGKRNTYQRIYMFKPGPNGTFQNPIRVQVDGACKQGWEDKN